MGEGERGAGGEQAKLAWCITLYYQFISQMNGFLPLSGLKLIRLDLIGTNSQSDCNSS